MPGYCGGGIVKREMYGKSLKAVVERNILQYFLIESRRSSQSRSTSKKLFEIDSSDLQYTLLQLSF